MTFVVTEQCIKCKYMDCIEVCPVDCFHVGANMLVINPAVCIDCTLCEPECPIEAIRSEDEPGMAPWVAINRQYADLWPVITRKGEPPANAKEWETVPDKWAAHFDPAPGQLGT